MSRFAAAGWAAAGASAAALAIFGVSALRTAPSSPAEEECSLASSSSSKDILFGRLDMTSSLASRWACCSF